MGILGRFKKRKNSFIKVNVKIYHSLFNKHDVISSSIIVKKNSSLSTVLIEFCKANKLDIKKYKKYSAILDKKYEYTEFKKIKVKKNNTEILFIPDVGMPAAIPLAGMIVGGLVAHAIVATATSVMVGMMIGSMVGSILEYALYPPKTPNVGIGSDKTSPTYSWDRIQNTLSPEQPVPLVYGIHKVGGEFINIYTDNKVKYELSWQNSWTKSNQTQIQYNKSGNINSFTITGYGVKLYPELHSLLWETSLVKRTVYSFLSGVVGSPINQELKHYSNINPFIIFSIRNLILLKNVFLMDYRVRYKKSTEEEWVEILWDINNSQKSIIRRPSSIWDVINSDTVYSGRSGNVNKVNPLEIIFDEYGTYDFEITPNIDDILPVELYYLNKIDVRVNLQNKLEDVDSYLNVLLALSEGKITSIDDIKINNQPIDYFKSEILKKETRLGTNDQTPISAFSEVHSLNESVSQNINGLEEGSQKILIETSKKIEGFRLNFTIPALYDASSGNIRAFKIEYKIAYQKKGDEPEHWLYESDTLVINKVSTSSFDVQYICPNKLDLDYYVIQITRLTKNYESDTLRYANMKLASIDEIIDDKLSYPNTALLGIKFLASDRLSGSLPDITSVVRGIQVLVPELKIDMYPDLEVPYQFFYFDGTDYRCFGLKAHYTGNWITTWTNNPVWIIYDILTNKRYGLGKYLEEGESFLLQDKEDLKGLAEYCDELVTIENGIEEKRFMLDCVIDSDAQGLDLIHSLCSTFRCFDFISNGKVHLSIDKPEVPVQMFNSSNIVAESFSESFSSISETPNVIEISFLNREKDYEKDTIVIEDRDDLLVNPIRKKSFNLYGITRPTQALRMAKYFLLSAKLSKRIFNFSTSIDGFVCQPGDVILFQHDVSELSYGGRIVNSTDDKFNVFLDTEITVDNPTDYEISIRFNDLTVETRNIVSINGFCVKTDIPFSKKPDINNIWIISEKTLHARKLRVISIERDLTTANISAIEYNEDIYDETCLDIPEYPVEPIYTNLLPIKNLVLGQRKEFLPDGTIQPIITVGFTKPQGCFVYDHSNLYISDDDGKSWKFIGSTKSDYFEISGYAKLPKLIENGVWLPSNYKVAVASVDKQNKEISSGNWVIDGISILPPTPPNTVTGFQVSIENDEFVFSWNSVSNPDLEGYEIYGARFGSSIENSQLIAIIPKSNLDIMTYRIKQYFPEGEMVFYILAKNKSGLYSLPDSLSVYIPELPGYTTYMNLQDYNLEGTITENLEKGIYYDIEFGQKPAVFIKTSDTWDGAGLTWDSSGKYWDLVSNKDGYYTTTEFDVGEILNAIIEANISILISGNCQYELQFRYKEKSEDPYSDWVNIELATSPISFRYIQFRVYLKAIYGSIYLFNIFSSVVLVNRTEKYILSIPDTGYSLTFHNSFHSVPSVVVTTVDNPYLPVVQNLLRTGCDIFLYSISDIQPQSGKVSVLIEGA